MSATKEQQIAAALVMKRIRELCDAGMAQKGEVGRFVLGEEPTRHVCCATVVNWLGGRTPGPDRIAKLKQWIATKERQMAKLCKPAK